MDYSIPVDRFHSLNYHQTICNDCVLLDTAYRTSYTPQELGTRFHLERYEIDNCVQPHETLYERRYQILYFWKQKNGENATYKQFLHLLSRCLPPDKQFMDFVIRIILEKLTELTMVEADAPSVQPEVQYIDRKISKVADNLLAISILKQECLTKESKKIWESNRKLRRSNSMLMTRNEAMEVELHREQKRRSTVEDKLIVLEENRNKYMFENASLHAKVGQLQQKVMLNILTELPSPPSSLENQYLTENSQQLNVSDQLMTTQYSLEPHPLSNSQLSRPTESIFYEQQQAATYCPSPGPPSSNSYTSQFSQFSVLTESSLESQHLNTLASNPYDQGGQSDLTVQPSTNDLTTQPSLDPLSNTSQLLKSTESSLQNQYFNSQVLFHSLTSTSVQLVGDSAGDYLIVPNFSPVLDDTNQEASFLNSVPVESSDSHDCNQMVETDEFKVNIFIDESTQLEWPIDQ